APFLFGHDADEGCARFKARIVKLFAALVLLEMLRILRGKECALMMIEPPGKPRIARILEIHDGVFIAVKQPVIEKLRGFVGHPGETELRSGMDGPFDKAGEIGG